MVLVILGDLVVLEVLADPVVREILGDLVAWFLDNLWVLNRLERQHLLQLERLAPQ